MGASSATCLNCQVFFVASMRQVSMQFVQKPVQAHTLVPAKPSCSAALSERVCACAWQFCWQQHPSTSAQAEAVNDQQPSSSARACAVDARVGCSAACPESHRCAKKAAGPGPL